MINHPRWEMILFSAKLNSVSRLIRVTPKVSLVLIQFQNEIVYTIAHSNKKEIDIQFNYRIFYNCKYSSN